MRCFISPIQGLDNIGSFRWNTSIANICRPYRTEFYTIMKKFYSIAAFMLLVCTLFAQTPKADLFQLIDKDWAFRMQEYPAWASSLGFNDDKAAFSEVSVAAHERRADFWRDILKQLGSIDRSALTSADQVNYDMFKFMLEDDVAQVEFQSYLIPWDSDSGFHSSFAFSSNDFSFDAVKSYEAYIRRLSGFKKYVDDHLVLLRLGIEKGMTLPKTILKDYEKSIEAYIVKDAEESHFFKPFKDMPGIDKSQQARLCKQAKKAINSSVTPAYTLLVDFIKNEYRPNARETLGAVALPNGKAYYQQRVDFYTTLDVSMDEVFEVGQSEVKRIRAAMEEVIKETGFEGTFEEFIHFLRTDPQFYCDTPKCLLKEAAYIAKKIDGRLPQLFSKLPSLPYGVEPVPDAIAPRYTTGRYVPGSTANHKSGTYWVNTYNLKTRPLYNLPALTLHEAVPGHHLQISLAEELKDLPHFRQHTYLSSYGEGWALYCEWLGQEMDIYSTPYEHFGRLTYEMWRACRLVVDVGMHAKGWTRDEAVDFLASNTALSLHNVNTEIDRYIGWPAQALSYKVGELKIRELRSKAEQELGSAFDIREFHYMILKNGAIPLFTLETIMNNWIEGRKR